MNPHSIIGPTTLTQFSRVEKARKLREQGKTRLTLKRAKVIRLHPLHTKSKQV